MPVDERPLLDRLTRYELYREAAAQGIQHPPDLPKYIWDAKTNAITGGMVPLLNANGVTPETMKTIEWRTIHPSPEEVAAAGQHGTPVMPQQYPVRKPRASGGDSQAALERKLSQASQDEIAEKDERIAELEATVKRQGGVLERMEAMLSRLEGGENPAKAGTEKYWDRYKHAQSIGCKVGRGMTLPEIEALIEAAEARDGEKFT